MQICS